MSLAPARILVGLTAGIALLASLIVGAPPASADPATTTVGGTVTASDTQLGIEDVEVSLITSEGYWFDGARTGSDGSWEIADVEPGDYRLQFSAYRTDYVSEWWDDQPTEQAATAFTVIEGEPFTADAELQLGASIRGTITADDGGAPADAVEIALFTADGEPVRGAETDSAGEYRIRGVAPGSYRLFFRSFGQQNLASEWWDDQPTEDASDLLVVSGSGEFVADAALATGGSISGVVAGDAPVGQADAYVTAYDSHGDWAGSTSTGADGGYLIGSLSSGSYTLRVTYVGDGPYSGQWWDGQPTRDSADPVAVTLGEQSTADFALVAGGSVAGTVTSEGDDRPLAGIAVGVYRSGDEVDYTVTDDDGLYSFTGLPDGSYTLRFIDEGDQGFAGEWWDDQADEADATPVVVTAGDTVTADAELRSTRASISGTVVTTGDPAVPVRGIRVDILNDDDEVVATTTTAANGTWHANQLDPGTYYVSFAYADRAGIEGSGYLETVRWWGGGLTQRSAQAITVEAGERQTADVALPVGGRLSGRVTGADAPSVGLEGVEVRLYNEVYPYAVVVAVTDDQGHYDFSDQGLFMPGSYSVRFDYPDAAYYDEVRSAQITSGGDTVTNATLTKAGSIVGTVTGFDTGGAGLPGVIAIATDGSRTETGWTDENGRYEITGLVPGTWTVSYTFSCTGCPENHGYGDAVWPGGSIEITNAGERVTANAHLPTVPVATGSLWGRIIGSDIAPVGVSNIRVSVYTTGGQLVGSQLTDSDGDYDMFGLPAGSYVVKLQCRNNCVYPAQYLGGTWTRDGATVITLAEGQREGAGGIMRVGGRLEGFVKGTMVGHADGVAFVTVTLQRVDGTPIERAETNTTMTTQSGGAYSFTGLPPGEYRVSYNPGSSSAYPQQWFGQSPTAAGSTPVSIVTNSTTTATTFLQVGGHVTGTISAGPNPVPVEDLRVAIGSKTAFVEADGSFQFIGLSPGTYQPRILHSDDLPAVETLAPITLATFGSGATVNYTYPALGRISGTLTTAWGEPIAYSRVRVYYANGDEYLWASGSTDATGRYTTGDLLPGQYRLEFTCGTSYCSWPAQWHGGVAGPAQSPLITVGAGTTTLPSDELEWLSNVFGRVSTADGPVGYAKSFISVFDSTGRYVVGSYTQSNGSFVLDELPADVYRLRIRPSLIPGVAERWVTVDLTDSPAERVDVTLPVEGIVQGTVHPSSAPSTGLEGVPVQLFDERDRFVDSAETDGSGHYEIDGLAAGEYTVRFGPAGDYRTQWFDGQSSGSRASALTVTAGGTVTADATLRRAGDVLLPLTTATPTISGSTVAGSTLTASAGTWGPAPVTLTYQWKRGGATIAGAKASTYVPSGADVGQTITVTVTGSRSGYESASVTSAATATITAGTITPATPTISGTAQVGRTLTAAPGVWTPAGVALAFAWNRDGAPIDGATAPTYVLTTEDQGRVISVTVTGTRSGFGTRSRTSAGTAKVAAGVLDASTPTISGSAVVGQTLTANPGAWSEGTTLTYTWRRAGVVVGTASTYTLVTADAGKAVTVAVTGAKAGYASVTRTSAAVTPKLVLTATPVPTIKGTPAVGQTLTAVPGTWAPKTVTLKYQWFRDGVAISKAINPTYKLAAADADTSITVTVTGSRTGYATVARTSAAAVVPDMLTSTPVPVVTGTLAVGQTLTATPGTWAPAAVDLAYQWKRNGTAIAGATGATYELVAADGGTTLTVTVTGSKAGYTSIAKTSAGKVIPRMLTATPVPVIAGTPAVGQTLTAKPGTWAPKTVTLKYQWLRDGIAISKATAVTYKLTAADADTSITVRVTGSRSGYTTIARTSAAAIVPDMLTATPVPVASGAAAVGQTLTASAGTWAPADVDLAYQWKRNGVAISGATASAYELVAVDGGTTVTVTVTGSKAGYTSIAKTSAGKVVPRVLTATPVPTVTGTATVGSTLRAVTGTWAPKTVTLKVQWLRDGVAISKATALTYKITAADAGRTITVRVTGSKTGYTSVTRESAGTAVPPAP